MESLKNLFKNPDIIIQKSDKGNCVVILDRKSSENEPNTRQKQAVSDTVHTRRKTVFWLIWRKRYVNLSKNYINLTSSIRKHTINCPVGSQSGPKTRFEFGQRYKFVKSLEHHKRQKILQTDRSFAFCFILSLDKYALLQKTSFFIGRTFFKYGTYNKKHGIFIYNFCFQRFLTIQTS